MAKAIVVLAEGFEEIEALTTVDILRRAGVDVDVVGLDAVEVTGAHGVPCKADRLLADTEETDAVILPSVSEVSEVMRNSPVASLKMSGELAQEANSPR